MKNPNPSNNKNNMAYYSTLYRTAKRQKNELSSAESQSFRAANKNVDKTINNILPELKASSSFYQNVMDKKDQIAQFFTSGTNLPQLLEGFKKINKESTPTVTYNTSGSKNYNNALKAQKLNFINSTYAIAAIAIVKVSELNSNLDILKNSSLQATHPKLLTRVSSFLSDEITDYKKNITNIQKNVDLLEKASAENSGPLRESIAQSRDQIKIATSPEAAMAGMIIALMQCVSSPESTPSQRTEASRLLSEFESYYAGPAATQIKSGLTTAVEDAKYSKAADFLAGLIPKEDIKASPANSRSSSPPTPSQSSEAGDNNMNRSVVTGAASSDSSKVAEVKHQLSTNTKKIIENSAPINPTGRRDGQPL